MTEEQDLGVIIQNDLKCSSQCIKAVKIANRGLGTIKRTFSVKDKNVILPLYKSSVGPYLEYGVQAWRPHYRKDIDLLEGVQRQGTKLISSLEDKTYEERLSYLKLTMFETRRLRGDLIEVFQDT